MNLFESYKQVIQEKIDTPGNDTIEQIRQMILSPDESNRQMAPYLIKGQLKMSLGQFFNAHMKDYMEIFGLEGDVDEEDLENIAEHIEYEQDIILEGYHDKLPSLGIYKSLENIFFVNCDLGVLHSNLNNVKTLDIIAASDCAFTIHPDIVNSPNVWQFQNSTLAAHKLSDETFAKMQGVGNLWLQNMQLNQVPQGIYHMKKLNRLDMSHNGSLHDINVQAIANMPSLKFLDLSSTGVSQDYDLVDKLEAVANSKGFDLKI